MKYGHWTFIRDLGGRPKMYECQCDCGKIRSVSATALRAGATKSCGCAQINKKNDAEQIKKRLLKNMKIDFWTGCWEWQKGTAGKGYGYMAYRGGVAYTHRISYELHHGPIPEGLCVCHTCDNPPCVNPDHLFLGTHKDNSQDCIKKGRFVAAMKGRFGMDCPTSKLTVNQVLAIRGSDKPSRALGREYGVAKSTILRIRHRKVYSDIPEAV